MKDATELPVVAKRGSGASFSRPASVILTLVLLTALFAGLRRWLTARGAAARAAFEVSGGAPRVDSGDEGRAAGVDAEPHRTQLIVTSTGKMHAEGCSSLATAKGAEMTAFTRAELDEARAAGRMCRRCLGQRHL